MLGMAFSPPLVTSCPHHDIHKVWFPVYAQSVDRARDALDQCGIGWIIVFSLLTPNHYILST